MNVQAFWRTPSGVGVVYMVIEGRCFWRMESDNDQVNLFGHAFSSPIVPMPGMALMDDIYRMVYM